jgi:glycosyltransferase involved in cell wall biosynthesis
MTKPLVSIIIANYNRADLIEETLNSIKNQSYSFFECIIVDDGSTDDSVNVIQNWIKRDDRFQFFRRPKSIRKGANACRNWGFMEKSKGDLIKFFDSDDIMLKDHVKISVEQIIEKDLDFVVVDCQNFDEDGLRERPYETNKNYVKITPMEFAKFQNAWITNDLMLKRELASGIEFNEFIRDLASEYQYGIKLLLLTDNGILVPDILTHRRVHLDSFVVKMEMNKLQRDSYIAETKLFTAEYLRKIAPNSLIRWFLEGHVQYCFNLLASKSNPRHFKKAFRLYVPIFGPLPTLIIYMTFCSAYFTGKGYSILKYIRHR